MKALLIGFGPFPRAPFNPTQDLVRSLAKRRRPGLACVAAVLPVSYAGVARDVPALIAQHRPDIVLLFGLAARTPYLRIETRARNALSVLFPDAEGRRAIGPRIVAGGESERRGRAPFVRVLSAVKAQRLPVRLSRDAGRYICNIAYWQALAKGPALVQFVHVPDIARGPRRARGRRRLLAADLVRAGETVLRTLQATLRTGR